MPLYMILQFKHPPAKLRSFSSLGNIIMNMAGHGPLLNPEAEPGPPQTSNIQSTN